MGTVNLQLMTRCYVYHVSFLNFMSFLVFYLTKTLITIKGIEAQQVFSATFVNSRTLKNLRVVYRKGNDTSLGRIIITVSLN